MHILRDLRDLRDLRVVQKCTLAQYLILYPLKTKIL